MNSRETANASQYSAPSPILGSDGKTEFYILPKTFGVLDLDGVATLDLSFGPSYRNFEEYFWVPLSSKMRRPTPPELKDPHWLSAPTVGETINLNSGLSVALKQKGEGYCTENFDFYWDISRNSGTDTAFYIISKSFWKVITRSRQECHADGSPERTFEQLYYDLTSAQVIAIKGGRIGFAVVGEVAGLIVLSDRPQNCVSFEQSFFIMPKPWLDKFFAVQTADVEGRYRAVLAAVGQCGLQS